jgi:hypothetical protein
MYEMHLALPLKAGCDIHVMMYVYLFGECFLLYV